MFKFYWPDEFLILENYRIDGGIFLTTKSISLMDIGSLWFTMSCSANKILSIKMAYINNAV